MSDTCEWCGEQIKSAERRVTVALPDGAVPVHTECWASLALDVWEASRALP